MSWLCTFLPCRWIYHYNGRIQVGDQVSDCGVYQCSRCKTISVGAVRP